MQRPLSFLSFLLISSCAEFVLLFPSATQAQKEAHSTRPSESEPINLKVLAGQHLTVSQVREIMEDWTDEIGADCSTCHVRNPKLLIAAGRPHFNYADDSKQEKKTARVMYSMTQVINAQYVATVPNSGIPVTCGTCHRGHLSPEPYSGSDVPPVDKTQATRAR